MSDELKPCPFCSKIPKLVNRDVEPQGDPWYGTKCESFILCECGACLFDGGFHEGFWDPEKRAVEAWNKWTDQLSNLQAAKQQAEQERDEYRRNFEAELEGNRTLALEMGDRRENETMRSFCQRIAYERSQLIRGMTYLVQNLLQGEGRSAVIMDDALMNVREMIRPNGCGLDAIKAQLQAATADKEGDGKG